MQLVVELTGPAHEARLRTALETEYGAACVVWGDEVC